MKDNWLANNNNNASNNNNNNNKHNVVHELYEWVSQQLLRPATIGRNHTLATHIRGDSILWYDCMVCGVFGMYMGSVRFCVGVRVNEWREETWSMRE